MMIFLKVNNSMFQLNNREIKFVMFFKVKNKIFQLKNKETKIINLKR